MITLDLMSGYGRVEEQAAIQEAAAAGLRGMEQLISQLSRAGTGESGSGSSELAARDHRLQRDEEMAEAEKQQQAMVDCLEVTDMTVSRLKKVISMLNHRTGHARFRRGPVVAQSEAPVPEPAAIPARSAPALTKQVGCIGGNRDNAFSVSAGASSSFLSLSTTGDRSGSLAMPLPAQGQKRRCHAHAQSENLAGGRCHCSKRRR
jgi:hypothetical protein